MTDALGIYLTGFIVMAWSFWFLGQTGGGWRRLIEFTAWPISMVVATAHIAIKKLAKRTPSPKPKDP